MKISISYGASETGEVTVPIPVSGITQRITKECLVVIPNTTNNVTFTLNLRDENNYVRMNAISIPRNAATLLLFDRIVKSGYTIGIQASGATGNNITIDIYLDFWS